MTEPNASAPAPPTDTIAAALHEHAEGRSEFKAYLVIFALLCVFTAVSFVCNELERHGVLGKHASLVIIMAVAVVKAVCVAMIFMHLKWDFSKVYFIIIPVSIMGVMMMIVFLPDIVLVWHHAPPPPLDAQP
jgi:caa(3)-type oxidase subunit IV